MLEDSMNIIIEAENAILKFEGEIVFSNSNQLKEETKKILSHKYEVENLIIDLSKVDYLDSSGVGVLLSLFKFMRERDGSLAVVEANEKIQRVFDVTKIGEIIPVHKNLEEAAAQT